jgi:hypothetical protein
MGATSTRRWSRLEREGERLYAHGQDLAAARRFQDAVRAARASGCADGRLAVSLYHLAVLHQHLGHYRLAERACAGALCAEQRALGADHPYVADILRRYAAILRHLARPCQADQAEARASRIMAGPRRANREDTP